MESFWQRNRVHLSLTRHPSREEIIPQALKIAMAVGVRGFDRENLCQDRGVIIDQTGALFFSVVHRDGSRRRLCL